MTYRDAATPEIVSDLRKEIDELQGEVDRLGKENERLMDRLHHVGLDLLEADKLPVWVAPYLNWWDSRKGSRCPGCGAQSFSYPREKVHGCDFVSGDHVHVRCGNCHEVACWQEKK